MVAEQRDRQEPGGEGLVNQGKEFRSSENGLKRYCPQCIDEATKAQIG